MSICPSFSEFQKAVLYPNDGDDEDEDGKNEDLEINEDLIEQGKGYYLPILNKLLIANIFGPITVQPEEGAGLFGIITPNVDDNSGGGADDFDGGDDGDDDDGFLPIMEAAAADFDVGVQSEEMRMMREIEGGELVRPMEGGQIVSSDSGEGGSGGGAGLAFSAEGDEYAFLDSTKLAFSNWAGPTHWKFRKPKKGIYLPPLPLYHSRN